MTANVNAGLLSGAAAIVVGFLAVTSQSLWIDEANSAIKAITPTLSAFIDNMTAERGSDLQMPLYMGMLWRWEKVFGHSEFALRAMNIPLFISALALTAAAWRTTTTQRIFFVLFACSSAFVWAYLDEARPYILQFLGATACAIPLANAVSDSRCPRSSDIGLFAAGALILCGSSLLGVISSFWFSAAFLILWLMKQTLTDILKRTDLRFAIIFSLPLLLILAAYYLWTLSLGAGASTVGSTNILSIGYAIYELLGMAGLGPGRSELRSSPGALFAFAPALLAYTAIVGSVICAGIKIELSYGDRPITQKNMLAFWMAPIAAAATTIVIGVVADFRVVGRHLTPLLPFFLVLFSAVASTLWQSHYNVVGRGITVLAILAMLASAIFHRASERHTKDDYRSAASYAHEIIAQGGIVWWAADQAAAHYYQLKTETMPERGDSAMVTSGAYIANNRSALYLAGLPYPALVVLSKVDIYDQDSNLRHWIAENRLSLKSRKPAFEFYTNSEPSD